MNHRREFLGRDLRTKTPRFLEKQETPDRVVRRVLHRPELSATDKPRVPWAELLRRTFLINVLKCERCGARRQVLWPAVPSGPIARELLAHLGLDAAPPELAPARGPPWEESWAS